MSENLFRKEILSILNFLLVLLFWLLCHILLLCSTCMLIPNRLSSFLFTSNTRKCLCHCVSVEGTTAIFLILLLQSNSIESPKVPPLNEESTDADVKEVLEQWFQSYPIKEKFRMEEFQALKQFDATRILRLNNPQLRDYLGCMAGDDLYFFLHPGMK